MKKVFIFFFSIMFTSCITTILYAKDIKTSVKEAVTIISGSTEQDTENIKRAFSLLEDLPQEQILEELVAYLRSDTHVIRRAAIFIIYKSEWENHARAIEPLIYLLSHEEDFTRGMAAVALGELKVNDAFNKIVELSKNDSSPYVRRCAVYALGVLGNKKAIPYLEQALNDDNKLVQHNAKYALDLFEKR